jgi:hypothetical protein
MLRTTMMMVFAFGAVVTPVSISWTGPLEAPPEAIVTGGALLVLASILRQYRVLARSK